MMFEDNVGEDGLSAGVVHANVGQNVTPYNPSSGLFLYHFLHTMVS